MSYIEWTQEFAVGSMQMDQQHQRLFKYVNDYYAALEADMGVAALLKTLDQVIDYTVFHFADEEKLMDCCNFPGVETHKLIHRQLEEQVIGLRGRLAAGEAVANEIRIFLKNWLTAHIKGIDTKYSPYVS